MVCAKRCASFLNVSEVNPSKMFRNKGRCCKSRSNILMQFRSYNQDPILPIPCYNSGCQLRSLLVKRPIIINLYGCARWGYPGRYINISFFYFYPSRGPKGRNKTTFFDTVSSLQKPR